MHPRACGGTSRLAGHSELSRLKDLRARSKEMATIRGKPPPCYCTTGCLIMERFVALDVEVSSRRPLRTCAIAAVRIEAGRETGMHESLVKVGDGPVKFTRIHNLTAIDLADAPPWPDVWRDVVELIGDIRVVVAFHARFDRGAILTMCALHRVRVPRLRFVCAADMLTARYHRTLSLQGSLLFLGLTFPGRPHDPLADARAAAMVALACSSELRV